MRSGVVGASSNLGDLPCLGLARHQKHDDVGLCEQTEGCGDAPGLELGDIVGDVGR